MASPPIPPSLEHLATRPFSFYPPIINIEHNEWLYRKATWSEILVVNCKSGTEIWISRRFVGEISRIDDPVLIVGLTRELEYKGGAVWPYQRRVIEMPLAVGAAASTPGPARAPERSSPAPIVGIRLESSDRRVVRFIGIALMAGILLCIVALNLNRVGQWRQRFTYTASDQSFLDLTGRDDYLTVVQKMGPPATDHSREIGTIYYRALGYPDRHFTLILMGREQSTATYIGTMDQNWHPVTSGPNADLLRQLKRF
jgi:hypothetical protein